MASNLIQVKYVGHCPAVEVDPDGLGWVEVVREQTISVPAEYAASILEQPANWVVSEPVAPIKPTQPVKVNAEEAK